MNRGQIIKRGSSYLLRVYLGQEDGKKQYLNRTVKGTISQARQELTRMLREVDTCTYVQPSNQTLADYMSEWLETKRGTVAESTFSDYSRLNNSYIVPALGKKKLSQISPMDVQLFYSGLDLSPRSVRYVHSVLRQALGQAVKWNLLVRNPAEHAELPKRSHREIAVLSKEDAQAIIETGDPLWILLLTTGLRPSEALALRWEDLSDDRLSVQRALKRQKNGTYTVGSTKTTGSKRTVSLPEVTVAALRRHKAAQAELRLKRGSRWEDQDLIFPNGIGGVWDVSKIRRLWKKTLRDLEIDEVRLYDTRHTHATHLLASGVDLKFVSDRLGHSSITLTADTYSHVLPETGKQIADTVQAMYGT